MGDMGDIARDLRDEKQRRRAANLAAADPAGWNKYTEHHWWRKVDGYKMDYWPSANKWLYKGIYYRGGLPQKLRDLFDERRNQATE